MNYQLVTRHIMSSDNKVQLSPGLLVLALSLVLLVVGAFLGFQSSSSAHPDGNESLWIKLLIFGALLGVIGFRTRKDEIRDSQGRSGQIRSSEGQIAVHGFFSFALGIMAIGVIVSVIIILLSLLALLALEITDPILVLVNVLLSISITLLGIYALIRTFKQKSDGIYLLCAFLIVNVLGNVFSLSSSYATDNGIVTTIASIIWAVIFITYFFTSKQVKELFPPKERTFTTIDIILCVSSLVLILISAFLD